MVSFRRLGWRLCDPRLMSLWDQNGVGDQRWLLAHILHVCWQSPRSLGMRAEVNRNLGSSLGATVQGGLVVL